jgi:hypothetical protein
MPNREAQRGRSDYDLSPDRPLVHSLRESKRRRGEEESTRDSPDRKRRRSSEKEHTKRDKEERGEKEPKRKKAKKERTKKKKPYGYYGILQPSDYARKQGELESWLREVKGASVESLSRRDLLKHFEDYRENYNMALLPHKKYIDRDKWEGKQRRRQLRQEAREAASLEPEAGTFIFDDEEALHRQQLADRERRREEASKKKIETVTTLLKSHGKDVLLAQRLPEREFEIPY